MCLPSICLSIPATNYILVLDLVAHITFIQMAMKPPAIWLLSTKGLEKNEEN